MTKNWKQTIPFTGQVAKQTVTISYHGTLLNNNKKQTTDTHNNLDEFPKNYAELKKKSQSQKAAYYRIPFM